MLSKVIWSLLPDPKLQKLQRHKQRVAGCSPPEKIPAALGTGRRAEALLVLCAAVPRGAAVAGGPRSPSLGTMSPVQSLQTQQQPGLSLPTAAEGTGSKERVIAPQVLASLVSGCLPSIPTTL